MTGITVKAAPIPRTQRPIIIIAEEDCGKPSSLDGPMNNQERIKTTIPIIIVVRHSNFFVSRGRNIGPVRI